VPTAEVLLSVTVVLDLYAERRAVRGRGMYVMYLYAMGLRLVWSVAAGFVDEARTRRRRLGGN
jgi:cytochrome c biogenesis protein CcdA